MNNTFLDLLIRPGSFFSKKILEPVNLRIPALIVLVGAVIGAIQGYVMSGLYARLFSQGDMASMGLFLKIIGAVSGFLGFLIIWWLALSVVLYLVSMFFSGSGPLKRTIEFAGYALIPVVIGSLVTLALAFYYIPDISVPALRSIQDPAVIQEVMAQLMNDPVLMEFTQVSTLISLIFLIWTANILVFAMKYARELNVKHAVLTVAIPVLVYVIYMVYTIFSGNLIPGGV